MIYTSATSKRDEMIGALPTLENWRCTNIGFAMKNWERARMKAER